jgi:hypothetical protein
MFVEGLLNPFHPLQMRPQFDREEDFLIAYYRQRHAAGGRGEMAGDLAVLLAGSALLGVGILKDDITWVIIGFGIVTYRFVQGILSSAKYNRILGSIIEKYERASIESDDAGHPPAGE